LPSTGAATSATQPARQKHLDAMATELDRVNRKLDATFAKLARLRATSSVAERTAA